MTSWQWGIYAAILGGAGYAMSPIYRGLTIQFKVYVCHLRMVDEMLNLSSFIQMSGMILGSMLEADYRLREYEAKVRMQKRMIRDRAVWDSFEKEYEQPPKQDKS